MKISVVIPALNEAATVGKVIEAVAADDPHEIIVIDADSTDSTAAEASPYTLNWRDVLPDIEPKPGKGESLWRGVAAASGDVVCFIDADLTDPQPGMVRALCRPLKHHVLVKATYARTINGQPTGGGRVTELTAKPLIQSLYPHLAHVDQPLAGEYAIRAEEARLLPFVAGYGVEAGLLVDVGSRWGRASISQVQLPPRAHRNKPLHELAPMAETVAATLLQRAGIETPSFPGQRPPLETVK